MQFRDVHPLGFGASASRDTDHRSVHALTDDRTGNHERQELARLDGDVDQQKAMRSVDRVTQCEDPQVSRGWKHEPSEQLFATTYCSGGQRAPVDRNYPIPIGTPFRLGADDEHAAVRVTRPRDIGREVQVAPRVGPVVLALDFEPGRFVRIEQEVPQSCHYDPNDP